MVDFELCTLWQQQENLFYLKNSNSSIYYQEEKVKKSVKLGITKKGSNLQQQNIFKINKMQE